MLKRWIKKIVFKEKADSESYTKFLKKLGCRIGERVQVYVPQKTTIDVTRPWLIDIGNDVRITEGVRILTHGYDWSVLKGVYGEVLGSSGKVTIGNNVFIGMNSTILKGVSIGNNVIIGANSLVNKNIPDNVVVAGNPCRIIMSLEEYYEKRKKAQVVEAMELVKNYRETYGKEPNEEALREHFWLFSNNPDELPECWKKVNRLCGNENFSNEKMKQNKKKYENMEQFLKNVK